MESQLEFQKEVHTPHPEFNWQMDQALTCLLHRVWALVAPKPTYTYMSLQEVVIRMCSLG